MFILLMFLGPWAASAATCDAWFEPPGQASRGVVVVTHGMNMRPDCMDSLAHELAAEGFTVFRPAFAGHCVGTGDYLRVTSGDWEADARRIYRLAQERATARSRPLYLLAYSFSAAVFQGMSRELPFERRIYLAPPFATQWWYPVARKIAQWFPDFTYQSRNPHCAANSTSSARSLLALDDFLRRKALVEVDEIPTLVLAEPEDELVNFSGVKDWLKGRESWRLEAISNRGHTLPKTYHHLVVDEVSLGGPEWARVKKLIRDFFRPLAES